jgi:hypothetical protein
MKYLYIILFSISFTIILNLGMNNIFVRSVICAFAANGLHYIIISIKEIKNKNMNKNKI